MRDESIHEVQQWQAVCVLCATRNRETRLASGHCCNACTTRLMDDLAAILSLATDASAHIAPQSSSGGVGSHSFGSKPPINLDAIDPELAVIDVGSGNKTTILECLESWERLIREVRGMVAYGPASEARQSMHDGDWSPTMVTLSGVLTFLRRQLDWITTSTDMPLEDFADEISRCRFALNRWGKEHNQPGARVECPTVMDDGSACGFKLRVTAYTADQGDEAEVKCRGCGNVWTHSRLMLVAGSGAEGWADIEAICGWAKVNEVTVRRWARAGKVRKAGLLYSTKDVAIRLAEGA